MARTWGMRKAQKWESDSMPEREFGTQSHPSEEGNYCGLALSHQRFLRGGRI